MRIPLLLAVFLYGCGAKSEPRTDTHGTPVATAGDALVHQSRSEPTSSFWESTDAAAKGDVVYTCTGVQSLVTHNAKDPTNVQAIDTQVFPLSNGSFPRCSHVDVDGDRMVVAARNDEVQTEAWVSLLDVSQPRSPDQQDFVGFGDQTIEEAVVAGDRVYVAATDAGVFAYDVSSGAMVADGTASGLGTVTRIDRAPLGVAAGTTEGQLHLLGADLSLQHTIEMGAAVMGIEQLDDVRVAVALGSRGIAIVDATSGELLGQVETNGTALRLDLIDERYLLVANWSDLRVYDIRGDTPVIRAVDAVFESEDKPRTFGVASSGDRIYAATWTGLHALTWDPQMEAPEITLGALELGLAADGLPQELSVRVLNEGQDVLEVSDVKSPNDKWTSTPDSFSLQPGESLDVGLHYDGGDTVVLDTFKFKSNDPDEPRAPLVMRVGANAVFIGDDAVDFTYTALNTGQTYTLSEQRGKVVLLSYFATF